MKALFGIIILPFVYQRLVDIGVFKFKMFEGSTDLAQLVYSCFVSVAIVFIYSFILDFIKAFMSGISNSGD